MESLFSGSLKAFLYDDYVTFEGGQGITHSETVSIKYSDISSIGYGWETPGNFLKVNVCGYAYMFNTTPNGGNKENKKISDAILAKMKVIDQASKDYQHSSENTSKNASDNKALELKYQRALLLIKKLSFNNAVVVLKELGDYKNSRQLLSECEKKL